jgi:hypothetical protein
MRASLLVGILVVGGSPGVGADITFWYDSEPGDPIGLGLSNTYGDADGTWSFERNGDNGISFDFDHADPSIWWDLHFAAADDAFITVGSYPLAMRFPDQDPGHPGLEVTGEGRSCSWLSGSFVVTDVVYDWFCEPVRLVADFEQHCEGALPGLTGGIDLDAGLGPLSPVANDVFVTYLNRVYDFEPLLEGRAVPILGCSGAAPPVTEVVRDLVIRANGDIEVFNGTASPVLSSFDGATGTWQHHTFEGWSIADDPSYGGIAAFGEYVFVTDMLDDGNGIIRFDRAAGYAAQRFGAADYIDLNIGQDGMLCALQPDGTTVDRFNPRSMAPAGSVTLAAAVRAMAVNLSGYIFGASGSGFVYRFDRNGSEIDSRQYSGGFVDIDVTGNSYLLASTQDSVLLVASQNFMSSIGFAVSTSAHPVFVAVIAPDPADMVIFADGFDLSDTSPWSVTVP